MKASRLLKAVATALCVAVLSAAFAGTALAASPQDMLKKQKDIDEYLFEDHKDEIAAMGITVTHTAPMETYVEIGITPYSEESANYLYGIFGEDVVKIVEGEQAYPLEADEGNLVSAQDGSAQAASPVWPIALAAAAVVAGGAAFIMIRKKAADNR